LQALRDRKHLEILCGIALIAVLIATLWPFDFFPPNRVSWLPDANGIRFDSSGVVVSDSTLATVGTESRNSCSLEILLRPASIRSVHTILSFYIPNNPRQFLVRQWTDGLLVSRAFVDAESKVKTAKLDVDHFFQQGQLVLLTITSGPNGTVVYKDGRREQAFSRFTILQTDLSGQIVMGTSAVDYQPWQGEVRGLATYSQELKPIEVLRHYNNWISGRAGIAEMDRVTALFAFTEGRSREIHNAVVSGPDLKVPKMFEVPYKTFLNSPMNDFEATWSYVAHLFENIAGFVPLGFIVCGYLTGAKGRRAILNTIIMAGALSFAIEVLQAYMPERESDITDIITNTIGASIGAMLARPSMVQTILKRIQLSPSAVRNMED
jgi:glycopeptide antibiotics resistance protein